MASIFMRIDGIKDFKGMASIGKINNETGYFPISSFSFGFSRSVFIDVGSAQNAEVGAPTVGDVVVERESDAASPLLKTLFFAPGENGRTIEIIETKAKRDGKGLVPVQVITLEEARISSYMAQPGVNSITIAFTTIESKHWYETEAGGVEKSDVVKFNLKNADLSSGNTQITK